MIKYDYYNRTEPSRIYLSKPAKHLVCALNSIDEDTFSMTLNGNDTSTIQFNVYQYVDNFETGKQELSNGYDQLGRFMELYVDGFGWFKMQEPTTSNDGNKEYKSVIADSLEIELQQYDLVNFTINYGYSYSKEMLVESNIDKSTGYDLPIENIKFHNPNNADLSLLDLILKETPWNVGYVDTYLDNNITTLLKNEIYRFDVDTQDVYSFLCQDVAGAFNCIFVFDTVNKLVNAYRVEGYGKNTNIVLGYRNVQNSLEINTDSDSIYTVFTVAGSDDLNINYVNFGESIIEDYSYFLTTKYMPQDLIVKYKAWKTYKESFRESYMTYTKEYNTYLDEETELYNRVPLDDTSTDWSTFSDEDLVEQKSVYEAQLTGYEKLYVDSSGNFDLNALKNSVDWNDYWTIKNCIIPSIIIEQNNRLLSDKDDYSDYIDLWETNWDLFGLDELKSKLEVYQDTIDVAIKNKWNVPYSASSPYTEEYHNNLYNNYLKAINNKTGCQNAINNRQKEIDVVDSQMDMVDAKRTEIVKKVQKENYIHETLNGFTADELHILQCISNATDYQNDNIVITSLDTNADMVDIEYNLYKDAVEELSIESQPQYQYATSQDNIMTSIDYKDVIAEFDLGNFLHVGLDDDTFIKLRVISMEFNPMLYDNNLSLTFTNMLTSRSKRNDFASILDSAVKSAKNQISASIYQQNSDTNTDIMVSNNFIKAIVNSQLFQNYTGTGSSGTTSVVENMVADYVQIKNLSAEIANINNLNANSAFMKYLEANLVVASQATIEDLKTKVISAINLSTENAVIDSAKIGSLNADSMTANVISAINAYAGAVKIKLAQIDTAELGDVTIADASISTAKIINGAITNAKIADATIESAKIKNINADIINSGTLNTNIVDISSTDGTMLLQNNTLTIKDNQTTPQVRTQLGLNAQGGYGLIVINSDGTTIFDSDYGVMCEDGLNNNIVSTDKIVDNAVNSSKLNVDELFVGDNAFINSLHAVEIDASNITTGKISSERLDIEGLVSFNSFDESLQYVFSVVGDTTYINGGMLATNSIKANSLDLYSGLTVYGLDNTPTFAITEEGNVEIDGLLHSNNYDKDKQTGYEIRTDGTATFNNAVIRGDVILPNAGITSSETKDTSVRFWAGSDYENKNIAPFRVTQNGNLFAKNGIFDGTVFGSFDSDDLSLRNGQLYIGGLNYSIDENGKITNTDSGNPKVKLSNDEVLVNTDFYIGTVDDTKLKFMTSHNTLELFVPEYVSNEQSTVVLNNSDKNNITPIYMESQNGSKTHFRYNTSGGGLVFDNIGSKHTDTQDYDFKFSRKNDNEKVKVRIEGELNIGNTIKSDSHNIQIRSVADEGWGFYLA